MDNHSASYAAAVMGISPLYLSGDEPMPCLLTTTPSGDLDCSFTGFVAKPLTADEIFDRWVTLPPTDLRTLDEFASDILSNA